MKKRKKKEKKEKKERKERKFISLCYIMNLSPIIQYLLYFSSQTLYLTSINLLMKNEFLQIQCHNIP